MCQFIAFLFAAVIVLPTAGFAQERPATPSGQAASKESVWDVVMTTPREAQPSGKVETARGAVMGIEKDLARFTVLRQDNRAIVIQMELRTSRQAGNEIEIWDLRLGDRVTVSYRVEEGRNVARSITVER